VLTNGWRARFWERGEKLALELSFPTSAMRQVVSSRIEAETKLGTVVADALIGLIGDLRAVNFVRDLPIQPEPRVIEQNEVLLVWDLGSNAELHGRPQGLGGNMEQSWQSAHRLELCGLLTSKGDVI